MKDETKKKGWISYGEDAGTPETLISIPFSAGKIFIHETLSCIDIKISAHNGWEISLKGKKEIESQKLGLLKRKIENLISKRKKLEWRRKTK